MTIVKIDPLTRIEGHLKIETELEPNPDSQMKEKYRVRAARSSGLMFRGIEVLLEGRDPMDAHQIVQRICGVCPIPHGVASCIAQEVAYRAESTMNGRLLQNLVLVSDYLHSHIFHFYQMTSLDFLDIKAIRNYKGNDIRLNDLKKWAENEIKSNKLASLAPFLPRFEGDYLEDVEFNIHLLSNYLTALDVRTTAHEMGALFGSKMPHANSFIPTGMTSNPLIEYILRYQTRLENITHFIERAYLPDVLQLAKFYPRYFSLGKGPEAFLCAGGFRESSDRDLYLKPGVVFGQTLEAFDPESITEDVRYSYYSPPSGLRPFEGVTKADPKKQGAYSWIKAPRYKKKVMQVGPAARLIVQRLDRPNSEESRAVDKWLEEAGVTLKDVNSVMGRHLARAIECKFLAQRAKTWLDRLRIGEPSSQDFDIPESGKGQGIIEAARGTLGHWIKIKNYVIENYQCVVPTTWNCSPRDDDGQPGAVEQALEGCLVMDPKNPIETGRIVRSFDPCLACSVH